MSISGGTRNPGDGLSVVSDEVSGLGNYLSDLIYDGGSQLLNSLAALDQFRSE